MADVETRSSDSPRYGGRRYSTVPSPERTSSRIWFGVMYVKVTPYYSMMAVSFLTYYVSKDTKFIAK